MRRLTILGVLAAALAAPGCKRKARNAEASPAPSAAAVPGGLASTVSVSDSNTTPQLVKGFYGVEGGSWRWTAGQFTVALKTPLNASRNGALLVVRGSLPGVVLQRVGPVKLSAVVNGTPLQPEQFTRAGDFTHTRDVPASALTKDVVTVDFALDKFMPPSGADQRELGMIISTVGLEAK